MKLLEGKKGIVTGVVNHRSICWQIAKLFRDNGAEVALTYGQEGRYVHKLGSQFGIDQIHQCDVRDDRQIADTCSQLGHTFEKIDFLVHGIAYASEQELTAGVINTTRSGFLETMNISVYSLIRLSHALLSYLSEGASIISLSYLGANRVCNGYNVMGIAKAALESTNRYLANELGEIGVRCNVISSGPVRTLAGLGIPGFSHAIEKRKEASPIHSNITQEDVANTALYLASDLSNLVTGQVIYVDAGYQIMGTWPENSD